jgi:thiol-disulfide isomerase/thioredoxin
MIVARSIMTLVALVASVAVPAAGSDNAATNGRSITTLAHVPLRTRSGARIQLEARIKPGKPTLISIWASWCPPCIAEAPYLDRMRKDLGSGYNFLYVDRSDGDPDPDQPPAAVAQFLARGGLSDVDYVTADVKAYRQIVGKDISEIPDGKVGIPRVYLFDGRGRQIYTAYGFQETDGAALEQRVKQAMGK